MTPFRGQNSIRLAHARGDAPGFFIPPLWGFDMGIVPPPRGDAPGFFIPPLWGWIRPDAASRPGQRPGLLYPLCGAQHPYFSMLLRCGTGLGRLH